MVSSRTADRPYGLCHVLAPLSSTETDEGKGRRGGARAALSATATETPLLPSRSSSASKKSLAGAGQHLCLRSLAGRSVFSGTVWSILPKSAPSCRFSMPMLLCRLNSGRRSGTLRTPSWTLVVWIASVLLCLYRRQRNSWWICRLCCLLPFSSSGLPSRSSTFRFRVVEEVIRDVFKVFPEDSVCR